MKPTDKKPTQTDVQPQDDGKPGVTDNQLAGGTPDERRKSTVNVQAPNIVDAAGHKFDPKLHVMSDDGKTPVFTRKGYFAKRRNRAKPTGTPDPVTPETREHITRAAGGAAADALLSSAEMMGGEIWKASGDERKLMRTAFGEYFAAADIDDIPPGIMLSMVLVSYALPRLHKTIDTRGGWQRVTDKMKSVFKRKEKPAPIVKSDEPTGDYASAA